MLPRRAVLVLLGLTAAACVRVQHGDEEFRSDDDRGDAVSPQEVARAAIRARDIRSHVAFLASDPMRGRDTPGPELQRAAAWIAERFAAAGLDPAGDDGGFIHFWPYDTSAAGAGSPVQAPNVVGLLLGSDAARAGEYVIITAHFDHIGTGEAEDGDSIYNGADDNASGTAALLEIAHAFGSMPRRPVRPVLFLATSGREKGQLGAASFADDPTVFLSEAVAVLNMDMIGRNSPDSIAVIGHDYSDLGPLLVRTAAAPRLRLAIDTHPHRAPEVFRDGDHYPFARRGIPAILITSGPNADHHRPDDEAARLDTDKAARVARLVFLAAHELAMGADVTWTEEGRQALR